MRYYNHKIYFLLQWTFILLVLLVFPFVVSAQALDAIKKTIEQTTALINVFIGLFIALGLVYFFYGVAKYVTAKEATAKEDARNTMIYGLIGLFVLVSVWGIIRVIGTLTGVTPFKLPPVIVPPSI